MTHCPICKKKIDSFYKSECEEPFTHFNPMQGLTIYGPFSAEKETICNENGFLHFRFTDGENRLVELGVQEDFNEIYAGEDYDPHPIGDDSDEDLPF